MTQSGAGTSRDWHVFGSRVVVGTGGRVLSDTVVTIRGNTVTRVGPPLPGMQPLGGEVYQTVLPGLVDSHVHIGFGTERGFDVPAPEAALGCAAQQAGITLRNLLRHGVTTVRDLGCPGPLFVRVRQELARAPLAAPRLFGSSAPITTPGGHLAVIGHPVSSAGEAHAAVGACASDGADVIKVVVTGGRYTRGTFMGRASMSRELLAAVVAAAHAAQLPVAAHAHGTEGIRLAVQAGVDTIEHCSWADTSNRIREPVQQLLQQMRDRGKVIVTAGPLCPELVDWARTGDRPWPHVARNRSVRRQLRLWRNAEDARARGVTVALGTDSLFGTFPDDDDLLVRAELLSSVGGWTPLHVLEALTGAGGRACGQPGRLGVLVPGARADLIAVDGNPAEDLTALRQIRLVLRDGVPVLQHLGDRGQRVSAAGRP
jgi:imidazolonepropionase-like amidohydrolase